MVSSDCKYSLMSPGKPRLAKKWIPRSPGLCFPGGSDGKEFACNAGDLGLILGFGRSFGGGHGNPLQYSCLENPMKRGAWQASVQGVTKELDTTEDTHTA